MFSSSFSDILLSRRRIFTIAFGIVWLINAIYWIYMILLGQQMREGFLFNVVSVFFSLLVIILGKYEKKLTFVTNLCIIALFISSLLIAFNHPRALEYGDTIDIVAFPLFAIFFRGLTTGFVWIILYIISFFVLNALPGLPIHYSDKVVSNIISNIVSIYFIAFMFQNAVDTSEKALKTALKQAQNETEAKQQAMHEAQESLQQIEKQKEELEHLNKYMVNRELVMVELKKKLKATQDELVQARTQPPLAPTA